MKKIILLIIFVNLFYSCDEKINIEDKIVSELDKGIIKNDIFLSFMFGDNKNDVQKKLQILSNEGKIIYPIRTFNDEFRDSSLDLLSSLPNKDEYFWIGYSNFFYWFC